MFTRPEGVRDADIVAAVRRDWGLEPDSADYLAAGFGSHHWVAASAGGDRWFVTVDDLSTKELVGDEPLSSFDAVDRAFTVAQALRDLDLQWVVAPLSTPDGRVLSRLDERYSVAVFPHVDGTSHHSFESDAERARVVTLLVELHERSGPVRPDARRETFSLPHRDGLLDALACVDDMWTGGLYSEPARALLRRDVVGVRRLLAEYDELARDALRKPDGWTVTHGEPHSRNVLRTEDGLRVIDWDTVMTAPPERDLWMLIPERGDGVLERLYLAATGHRVNRDLLTLYSLAWDLSEIGGYLAEFRAPHEDTEDSRVAWGGLNESIRASADRQGHLTEQGFEESSAVT